MLLGYRRYSCVRVHVGTWAGVCEGVCYDCFSDVFPVQTISCSKFFGEKNQLKYRPSPYLTPNIFACAKTHQNVNELVQLFSYWNTSYFRNSITLLE